MNITLSLEILGDDEMRLIVRQYGLNPNEETVLRALQSAYHFIDERDLVFVKRNLEDSRDFASPRLRAMKKSVKEHLQIFGGINSDQHRRWVERHFEAFCQAIARHA